MIRRSRGLTFNALFVVLLAIVTFATILFPFLSSARERLRQSACIENYQQIGKAMRLYATDYDGKTPSDGGSFSGVIKDCRPYIKSAAIFACPDDFDRVEEKRPGSYRMPSLYQGLDIACGWPDPYAAGKTTRPTTTPLLYEAEQDFTQTAITPAYRHQGATETLYFDGHTNGIKSEASKWEHIGVD